MQAGRYIYGLRGSDGAHGSDAQGQHPPTPVCQSCQQHGVDTPTEEDDNGGRHGSSSTGIMGAALLAVSLHALNAVTAHLRAGQVRGGGWLRGGLHDCKTAERRLGQGFAVFRVQVAVNPKP